MKHIFTALLFSVLFMPSLTALAHGDDDHGAAPPAAVQSVAPRALAATEEFEVVALLDEDGKKLLVYLDHFASNEPVTNARVEIEGAGIKGQAKESAPGVYAIDAPKLAAGRHALTISIEAGDLSDLLTLSLDTSLPVDSSAHLHGWNAKLIWSLAALLMVTLAGMALLLVRRRKQVKV